MEEKLRVGVISSTHGIRGEAKVFPTTDNPGRFKKMKEVILDMGKEEEVLEIEGVKFFKNMVIVKFKGIDDINDMEKYKGKELYVTRENAQRLGKDEYFIADLIGMEVVSDDGSVKGILKDVMQTGANDVYVIALEDKRELLLPAIRECVLSISPERNEIRIHLLEGLLDE